MRNIVVVGSLNMDLVMTVGAMPHEGETVPGNSFAMHAGGKGANQAVAAARLGGNVAMIGAVGRDAFGDTLLAGLVADAVDIQAVKRVDGSSGCATILVTASGSNCIVVHPGANGHLKPGDLYRQSELLEQASLILCQLETPLDTVSSLCQIAAQLRIPLVLDPAPMRIDAATVPLLQHVSWLTPNETEAKALLLLLGEDVPDLASTTGVESAAHRLLQTTGARNLILKRGSQGIYMTGQDCTRAHIPAMQVEAIDTTAAGDTFNGAFACALVDGNDPMAAAHFACRAAAISTTRSGAQSAIPTREELRASY